MAAAAGASSLGHPNDLSSSCDLAQAAVATVAVPMAGAARASSAGVLRGAGAGRRSVLPNSGPNWTVKEGVRNPPRLIKAPNVVWPVTAAPLPKGMGDIDGENTFAKEQEQLRELWRHSSMNRYYLPISKMPPLGPDPRRAFGRRPPACCPDRSVPRINRIVERWNSMPQLRCQLPMEDLDEISAATSSPKALRALSPSSPPFEAVAAVADEARCRHGRRLAKKSFCDEESRDFPHVRCSCCDHPEPKPWLQKRTLGAAAAALIEAAMAPSS